MVSFVPPSGYSTADEFWGTLKHQLSLAIVNVQLTVAVLLAIIPRPDPEKPGPWRNRRINEARARRFADYLWRGIEHPEKGIIVPPLQLFIEPYAQEFEPHPDDRINTPATLSSGIKFGWFRIQKAYRNLLKIFDGQHRILGLFIFLERLQAELQRYATLHIQACTNGEPGKVIQQHKANLDRVKDIQEKFLSLAISVDIALCGDPKMVERLFADIADNAKGIPKSVSTRMDDRKVHNRVAVTLAETGLSVATEKDALSPTSDEFVSLKDLATVARLVDIGPKERMSAKAEAKADDDKALAALERFFDVLRAAFPALDPILDGASAKVLRQKAAIPSLLGSSVMLKALAMAYWDLRHGHGFVLDPVSGKLAQKDGFPAMADAEIVAAWQTRVPTMDAGAALDSRWRDLPALAGVFGPPWTAPIARTGNDKRLAMAIEEWSRT